LYLKKKQTKDAESDLNNTEEYKEAVKQLKEAEDAIQAN
jgi:hypothetical protein